MNNRASAVVTTIIIIIVLAVIAGGVWYFLVKKPEKCAKEGEGIGTCVGCIQKCCEGLKGMNSQAYDDECVKVPPPPGLGAICSKCGNGICDTQNNENKCTCPEDCKDETADWQTYRNEEYEFEIKYPEDAEIKESDYSEPGAIRFSVDFGEISNNKPVTIVVQGQDMEGVMREAVNIKSETEIIIGGLQGRKIVGVDQKGLSVNEIWVKNNGKIYIIKGQGQVFEQILSTFKFIETDETANWKTYRNEEYEFEIKYPEKWLVEVKDNPPKPLGCIQRTYLRKDIGSANIDILIFANFSKFSIREWLSQQGTEDSFEDTSLNAISALKSDKSDSSSYFIYMANENYIYMIDVVKFSDKVIVDTYNQILSTFKFIE
jgi:hypothetical protein